MEQHPIPQQITSYEFKLVGEMTLKQFVRAAGGIVLALLLNKSSLVFFVKWPLMILLGGGGLALAFVPFQDRPLETWILSFIKSIYSPTIFIWKKKSRGNWLEVDLNKKTEEDKEEEKGPIKDEGRVQEFIMSLPSVKREDGGAETVTSKQVKQVQSLPKEAQEGTEEGESQLKGPVEDNWRLQKSNIQVKKAEKLEATGMAVFGSIPMPDTPEAPNILVGMVTDNRGKIVEDAIIEIQDSGGNPSRVLKTNSLGQFRSSSQLPDGEYLVITEKEGFDFDRVKINLTGSIVEPIKIMAT